MKYRDARISDRVETPDTDDDDDKLKALGYVPSFKREFSNLATISFAFGIMTVSSSIVTTFNTPLLLGGPSSVVWTWFIGSMMCCTLGTSVAEIVSAYPTCGGIFTAAARLSPKQYRARVGWVVGWLSILGLIAGIASTEFGLSSMVWAGVVIGKNSHYVVTQGKVVGLFVGLVLLNGILNSLNTLRLARLTQSFVFLNVGTILLIIITLLATTPRAEVHPASYVFGSKGFANQTGGWNDGLAFLFGLLSVQWTMTGYDCTAHISEEVKRAAYAAPAAIFIAVVGSGIIGWLFNIVLILCSGPLAELPGPSGSAALQVHYHVFKDGQNRRAYLMGVFSLSLAPNLWILTVTLACSRTVYAFSRDHGLPDRQYFGHISSLTYTPLRAIWLCTFLSILPCLLDLVSPIAANAVFSVCTIALDSSFVIAIILRRVFHEHPDVRFEPGPFNLGNGFVGRACNWISIFWTSFVCVIFTFPTILPVTKTNMNYSSVIFAAVLLFAGVWYAISGHKHYVGPQSNLPQAAPTRDLEKELPNHGAP